MMDYLLKDDKEAVSSLTKEYWVKRESREQIKVIETLRIDSD